MKNMQSRINGLTEKESKEFIILMRKIDGVECNYYVRESVLEFKEIFTPIIISFGVGVASGVVANAIYDFLTKKKDEGKNVSISINTVNIYQNDNKGDIENKIEGLI